MSIMTDSMYELEQVLRRHAARYPLMQPTDAVKLIYQNEFGGGHLIRDEESCLSFLRAEYEKVEKNPHMPPYETLGNGIVRMHLAAAKPEELEQLGKAFIRSAAEHSGNMNQFLRKLDALRKVTAEGVFTFDAEVLERYLADYRAAGCPPVSHSETYRQAYKPAYRVILLPYAK